MLQQPQEKASKLLTTPHIVAPQPEAAEAGALILKEGGNAVDAAVATALVQTVVDPQMCGLAGFGTMQIYLPQKKFHGCIDFHACAPAACTPDMWEEDIEGETWDGFGAFLSVLFPNILFNFVVTHSGIQLPTQASSSRAGRTRSGTSLLPSRARARRCMRRRESTEAASLKVIHSS